MKDKILTVLGLAGGGVIMVGLFILILIAGPWLLFWSLNVLFGIKIALTFKTWLAAVILFALFRGGSSNG